jgi:hypothetical protein
VHRCGNHRVDGQLWSDDGVEPAGSGSAKDGGYVRVLTAKHQHNYRFSGGHTVLLELHPRVFQDSRAVTRVVAVAIMRRTPGG